MNQDRYTLESPLGILTAVSAEDINATFQKLNTLVTQGADAFFILRDTTQPDTYIQARWNTYRNAWQVEHRAGSANQHFLVFQPNQDKAQELFTHWMNHPETIADQASWRQIDLSVEYLDVRFKEFKQALFEAASKHWEKQGRRNRWLLRSDEVIYSLEFKKKKTAFHPVLTFGLANEYNQSTLEFQSSYPLQFHNIYPRFRYSLKAKYPGNTRYLFDSTLTQFELHDLYPELLDIEKRKQDFEIIFEALTEILNPYNSYQAIENNQDEDLIRAGLKFY